ncbi:corticotropin-releasing factor receptor 2-like [Tachypleus tridentatus]|uniref:corticotropin-releasing factor receptor 2-like n=1 Tax=Tachypleus tridentatus TaxID=6853 RepID=UPI003FD5DC58
MSLKLGGDPTLQILGDYRTLNVNDSGRMDGLKELSSEQTSLVLCQLNFENDASMEGPICPPIWDSFYCWPATSGGQTISRTCSQIFDQNKVPVDTKSMREAHAYRICNESGDWLWGNWTNYTECLQLLRQEDENFSFSRMAVTYILFSCSLMSLVSLFLALFIFYYFKSLQCSRLRVHRNLVVALILHSILLVIISFPRVLQSQQLSYVDVDWFCKSILTLKMYAAMASINWMFVEGLLLHSRITISIFNKDAPFKLYYFIGWGFPLVCVVSWAASMSLFLDSPCWRGYGNTKYIWLITGPMITALLVNTVFLINVIRILVTKLRMSVSIETTQVRKAIKATALLFPLLGITHLLFCINPRDDSHLERAYMITNAVLQSSQGIFVAVLYCFMNSEVQTVMRNAYLRAVLRRNPNRCLIRGRGQSHTSATYLTNYDTTVSDTTHHKMSPSTNIMLPLHDVCLPEKYCGRKKLKAPEEKSDREIIFTF